jgi:hypothetical protein
MFGWLRSLTTLAFSTVVALTQVLPVSAAPQCLAGYDLIPCSWVGGSPTMLCCVSYCGNVENNCYQSCLLHLPGDSYPETLARGFCNSGCKAGAEFCKNWGSYF